MRVSLRSLTFRPRWTRRTGGRGRSGLARPHHQLALEVADLFAALVDALRLDGDDPAIGLGGQPLLEHPCLGVDRVAVEGRLGMAQRLDLEVGDARAAHVGHAHAEHQRVHEVADDQVLAVRALVLREPRVEVRRMVVHRDQAEEVVVVLGDRLARPVLVDVARLEVLVVPAERPIVDRHISTLTRLLARVSAVAWRPRRRRAFSEESRKVGTARA